MSFARRLPHIDALKALAAQAIVLHHLLSYGPIARAAHAALPTLAGLLHQHGRLAVQVFLVIGGYLSARGLAPRAGALTAPLPQLLWRRYLRLALPFMAAVGLVLVVSAAVEPWLPDLVPESVSGTQLLAHALLLHGLLGHESLTAGAWYVAIDFQLFALLALMLAGAHRLPVRWRRQAGLAGVAALVLASAWCFNRIAELDHLAVYFFAAYGLGALVHWLGQWRHGRFTLPLLLALLVAALVVDFRSRLALAVATAALLALAQTHPWQPGEALAERLNRLGRESYALFLLHFPVLLAANALIAAIAGPDAVGLAAVALLASWWLSNRIAGPFHRWVEAPAARFDPMRSGSSAAAALGLRRA